MTLFNRAVIVLLVILTAGLGVESYTRTRVTDDLRQRIDDLSDQVVSANSSATKARAAAEAAADQARVSAAEARAGVQSAMGPAMRPGEAVAPSGGSAGVPVGPDLLTGKALATLLCAVCHVVASDQPTEPLRQPPAPDFRQIANRSGTTEASLRDMLARPHGPSEQMPEQGLVGSQVTVLVGYILSLRAQHPPH